MPAITERAPAKVNLSLQVTGRRADGYHTLASLVVFPEFGDVVTVTPAESLTLTVEGEFAPQAGAGEANLALRAARLLQQAAGIEAGATLRLEKHIPVGAGLGGGSADAAAILRALNRLWGLDYSHETLAELALPLGADVPMCVHARPLFATGIGEQIALCDATDLREIFMVLVYPRVVLPTPDVFRGLQPGDIGPAADARHAMAAGNALERAAVAACPVVGEVLQAMKQTAPEPVLVRMSGSGASCFALFAQEAPAAAYEAAMRQAYPQWWVRRMRTQAMR